MPSLHYSGTSMARFTAAALLALSALGYAFVPSKKAYAQGSGRCQSGGDEAAALLSYGKELATNTDSIYVATRQRYHITATDSSNVELVTSDSVCALAGDAYNAHLSVAHQSANRAVYVVRIGSVYIVTDPSFLPAGVHGLVPNMIFDANFALLAQFAA
jgi:hypothetical protein